MSVREIAKRLNIKPATVHVTLQRALRKMKKALIKEGIRCS